MSLQRSLYHPVIRSWYRYNIDLSKLIYPIFVISHSNIDEEIEGFEPNKRWSVKNNGLNLINHLQYLINIGLTSIMLFGVIPNNKKDSSGTMANSTNTPVILALQLLTKKFPKLLIAADVCLCEYTDNGHCCIFKNSLYIDNKVTGSRLADIALTYAKAGAHIICPSDMINGRIKAIRTKLDDNGFQYIPIMSYTSKQASCMYSPFRNAVQSTFKGTRDQYQHPIGSKNLAISALYNDLEEGADILVIKPALFSGDIINEYSKISNKLIACYIVSGEFCMLSHYANKNNNLINIILESHLSLIRAGANILITYFVPELLEYYKS